MVSFYSLLGVSSKPDYHFLAKMNATLFFLLPFGSFLFSGFPMVMKVHIYVNFLLPFGSFSIMNLGDNAKVADVPFYSLLGVSSLAS